MRNGRWTVVARMICVGVAVALLSGCGSGMSREQREAIGAGYQSLNARQFDEAISRADTYLAATPHGPGSAEAFYLKGRAYEGKKASDEAAAKGNLQNARAAYVQGLNLNPPQPLQAYLRAGVANVAYFQEDYSTALQQWGQSYEHLERDDLKAWALYRMGICQQRLGHFDQADRSFAQVQKKFPGTVPAARAKEHEGARQFFVQLATFANAGAADMATARLKTEGMTPVRLRSAQGNEVVRVGPVGSYGQAVALRNRFAGSYPDAVIVP